MLPIDYALQNAKGIKDSFANGVTAMIDQYIDLGIVDMYKTDQTFEIFTSTEGLSGTKELGSLETPPSSKLEDGYSVTITESRYGNAIELSEQTYRRDGRDSSVRVEEFLMRQRNQLLRDVKNKLLTDYHLFFNDAFNSSSTVLAPDGVELCGTHSWNTSGASTWSNAATAALDSSAVDAMETYAGAFTDASGKPMPLNFDTIVVKKGSDAHRTALRLFAFGITPNAVNDINIYEGVYNIIATPYITTANAAYWFGMALNGDLDNPLKLGIGEAPSLRDPIIQNNEAIRVNCTGFWKKGIVNMPMAVYGSDGTT